MRLGDRWGAEPVEAPDPWTQIETRRAAETAPVQDATFQIEMRKAMEVLQRPSPSIPGPSLNLTTSDPWAVIENRRAASVSHAKTDSFPWLPVMLAAASGLLILNFFNEKRVKP